MTTATDWSPEMYAYVDGVAHTIARSVSRSYPMVDAEDLQQEALLWAVSHPAKLQEYLDDADERRCTKMLAESMKNACRDYAVKTRAGERGDVALIDDVFYPLDALKGTGRSVEKRGLLHHVFDVDSWTNPEKPADDGPRAKRDPAEGNNWLATLADVSSALDKLRAENPDAHLLIESHFHWGLTYEQIGKGLEPAVSRETVSKRMDRAVKKVQELLGGSKPRKDPAEPSWEDGLVGTRRAISNAQARATTENAYDD